jgi:beta-glucanase (GH16 family)
VDRPSAPESKASRSTPRPSGPTAATPPATRGDTSGLLAEEDFNGSQLDKSRWQIYDATATNGVSKWTPNMVKVANGELQILGTGRNPSGQGNVSGGVCWCYGSAASRTYGRYEIRARFDAGIGFGQAVLLWPDSEKWPEDGEIDVVETPGGAKASAYATVHWGTTANHQQDSSRAGGDFTTWHVYTVDWRPTYIKIYIDGKLYYDSTQGKPQIPNTPMSLALQQEPGPFGDSWVPAPTSATPNQVTMHVDWIKVYR